MTPGNFCCIQTTERDICRKKALGNGDSYEMEFRLRRATPPANESIDPYRWHLGRAVAMRNQEGHVLKWFATWTEIEGPIR